MPTCPPSLLSCPPCRALWLPLPEASQGCPALCPAHSCHPPARLTGTRSSQLSQGARPASVYSAGLTDLLLKLPSLLRSECRKLAAGVRCTMKGKLSARFVSDGLLIGFVKPKKTAYKNSLTTSNTISMGYAHVFQ